MLINQAQNDKELRQLLIPPLKAAVEILMKKILETNKQVIMEVVYNKMGTPKYYQNTYEFLDAWDVAVHSSKAIDATIQGDFFYRPNAFDGKSTKGMSNYHGGMTSVPPCEENNYMGQHHGIGTNITHSMDNPNFGKRYGDSREYLADIIYQGLAGHIYGTGPWTRKRDAFSKLVSVVGVRNFNKWFKEAMQEVGLNVKSHGGIERKNT